MKHFITPTWPAPANVRALSTTRLGGSSAGIFTSMNMGFGHDRDAAVETNRAAVAEASAMPRTPVWLRQVHGTQCVDAASCEPSPQADASYAFETDTVCVVMTADCLPVLFCDEDGTRVAAAHAGWRGLNDGVLEATVAALDTPGERLLAWFGPAIGAHVYEVGPEVREAFVDANPRDASAFEANRPGHWLADLTALARARLHRLGIQRITDAAACTYSDAERFYSYRRDGSTGRMASFVWLSAERGS